MYNVFTQEIILEIPKCASRTLFDAVTTAHSKRAAKMAGHKTYKEIMADMETKVALPRRNHNPEVHAVVRHPTKRLHSCINAYMKIKNCGLDDAVQAAMDQSHIIFRPQHEFIDGVPDDKMHLYPIDNIDDAVYRITHGTVITSSHKNKGSYDHYLSTRLLNHADFYTLMKGKYSEDMDLYNAVLVCSLLK